MPSFSQEIRSWSRNLLRFKIAFLQIWLLFLVLDSRVVPNDFSPAIHHQFYVWRQTKIVPISSCDAEKYLNTIHKCESHVLGWYVRDDVSKKWISTLTSTTGNPFLCDEYSWWIKYSIFTSKLWVAESIVQFSWVKASWSGISGGVRTHKLLL